MLWKKSVRESRADCSRVWVIDRRRRVHQRLEMSGWKTKESSISRRVELVRQNIQLDEIRETAVRGLVVR